MENFALPRQAETKKHLPPIGDFKVVRSAKVQVQPYRSLCH